MTLPPLNFTFSGRADSRSDLYGNTWDMGNGAWTVNLAGSGVSNQSASMLSQWMIAAALGAAWFLLKK
jgi:hypothetical protein